MRRPVLVEHRHGDGPAPADHLALDFRDRPMPVKFGFPLKLRVPTKLGFKNPKFIGSLFVTNQYPGGLLGGSGLQLVQRVVSERFKTGRIRHIGHS